MSTTPERQRAARELLNNALGSPSNALVIHYGCESFDLAAPRITSIAIRNLGTRQTQSFSILHEAQASNTPLEPADTATLDRIERKMLDKFFKFVAERRNHFWLHWNMRDNKYGFSALEHRHQTLGGKPVAILDNAKVDLASLMFDLYGARYAAGPSRLANVAKRNKLTLTDYLDGAEQAKALAAGNFAVAHKSILRNVDLISTIAVLAHSRKLKTDASHWDQWGGSVNAIGQTVTRNWLLALVVTIAGLALGLWGIWLVYNPPT
jgi:hypothetical protein